MKKGNFSFESLLGGKERNVKVCLTASSGGHLEQVMMLKPLIDKYGGFVVTEKTAYSAVDESLKTYYLKQMNRHEISFPLEMFCNTFKSIRILCKEKPTHVISTGVLATLPICLLAKISGIKVIYIESFAKVNSATMSGKLMYHFADMFIVQWQPMLNIYPKAKYLGGIY